MNFRKRVLLFKLESTYGTDPTPAAASDALLVADDFTVEQVDKFVDRANVQHFLGHAEQIPVGTEMMLTCSVEMVGSGALGTAPAWGKLLKCCAFAETVNVGTSVVYTPAGTASSGYAYYLMDGKRHKLAGLRGDVEAKMTPGGVPYFKFIFTGLYGGEADSALVTPTLTAWKAPIAVNNANTSAFSIHGYSGKLYDFNWKMGNQVVHRDLPGGEDVIITDRGATGDIEIEQPTLTAKNFWTVSRAGTQAALSITHGVTDGYKVKIDQPNVQLMNPRDTDRDGQAGVKMEMRIMPGASGNDEVTITSI